MSEAVTARPCLDFYQFCDLVGKTLVAAWGPEWRERFSPEYPKDLEADDPRITYSLFSRVPSAQTRERRPRFFAEEEYEDGAIELWGRNYDVVGQFDVWSRSARQANDVVRRLSRFMESYTEYFREQGIVQLLFLEQLEDERLNRWRENWYIRSLRYFLIVQEQYVRPMGLLDQISLVESQE